jgi:PKD repeat protein
MNKEAQKYISLPLVLIILFSAILVAFPLNVAANVPPVAVANPDYQEVLAGEEAWFSANGSYDPDGGIEYYKWEFGDGDIGWGFYITHIYSSPGDYLVWLTVYDNGNATDMDYCNVSVLPSNTTNEPPVAQVDPADQTVAVGEDAWFYGGYSYDPDGYIVSYEWDFGDGDTGDGINISHIYLSPGIYNVTLTVTDNEGATDTYVAFVYVTGTPGNQPPVAMAQPDTQTVYIGEDAWFSGNGSYDPDGNITSYEWDFGDGNFDSGIFVTHAYTAPGDYIVTLTVTDNENETGTDTCIVYVLEPPLPLPPKNLDAELVSGALSDVRILWTASDDDGAGDNDVAGYTVYKSSTGIYGIYDFAAWIPAVGTPGYEYQWIDSNAGDGDLNNYFYMVRAKDTLDLEEQNTDKVGKFSSLLDEGWNMVSVPLIQRDTSKDTVLQTLGPNFLRVQGYHAGKSKPWVNWHRNKPNQFNDEISIDHKNGYYIDMLVSDHLVTAGKVASEESISMKTGWNLIGNPCLTENLRDDALSSIAGKYNMVERFDTVKDKEVRLTASDLMEPGLGYWIHVTEDCVWRITN